jgi:hypothetical protein
MAFWVFMLVTQLLIPLSMLGFGRQFLKGGPRKINTLFGYRTPMSMKNQETWEHAHVYAGRIWWKMGILTLPIPFVTMLPLLRQSTETIGRFGALFCWLQCILMLAVIPMTERELKRVFDKDGNRKSKQ